LNTSQQHFESNLANLHLQIKKDVHWLMTNKDQVSLNETFKDFIKQVNSELILDSEISYSVYFLSSISKLIRISDLLTEYTIDDDAANDILDFWSGTDLGDFFFDYLDFYQDLMVATLETMAILENKIMAFYYLHIDFNSEVYFENALQYPYLPNIGDSASGLYAMVDYYFPIPLDNGDHTIELISRSGSKKEITLRIGNNEVKLKGFFFQNEVNSEGRTFQIRTNAETFSIADEVKERTQRAINLFPYIDNEFLNILSIGTTYVVPMLEDNIVSYSMQDLPLFSSINYGFRDFVDHLDDLLHENGHHLLNQVLNTCELVVEDQEQDYLSPWRRSLRPARGIYHAFITFFWAHNLFSKLFPFALELSANETEIVELDRITFRYLEENLLMKACIPILELCIEDNKVSIEGEELLQIYREKFENDSKLIDVALITLECLNPMMYSNYLKLYEEYRVNLKHFHDIEFK